MRRHLLVKAHSGWACLPAGRLTCASPPRLTPSLALLQQQLVVEALLLALLVLVLVLVLLGEQRLREVRGGTV